MNPGHKRSRLVNLGKFHQKNEVLARNCAFVKNFMTFYHKLTTIYFEEDKSIEVAMEETLNYFMEGEGSEIFLENFRYESGDEGFLDISGQSGSDLYKMQRSVLGACVHTKALVQCIQEAMIQTYQKHDQLKAHVVCCSWKCSSSTQQQQQQQQQQQKESNQVQTPSTSQTTGKKRQHDEERLPDMIHFLHTSLTQPVARSKQESIKRFMVKEEEPAAKSTYPSHHGSVWYR